MLGAEPSRNISEDSPSGIQCCFTISGCAIRTRRGLIALCIGIPYCRKAAG